MPNRGKILKAGKMLIKNLQPYFSELEFNFSLLPDDIRDMYELVYYEARNLHARISAYTNGYEELLSIENEIEHLKKDSEELKEMYLNAVA